MFTFLSCIPGIHSYDGIYQEWKGKSKHNFLKFWADTVKDKEILKEIFSFAPSKPAILSDDDTYGKLNKEDFERFISRCDEELMEEALFQSKRSLGVKDYEGQRVMQVF